MLNKWCSVRIKILPSDMAGVAMMTSPIEFVASSSNSGPALTTNTSPSSLEKLEPPVRHHR